MWVNLVCVSLTSETDDKMRAFAEQVFASETKGEDVRDEFSLFDVADDCPIMHQEMALHLQEDEDNEKRWVGTADGDRRVASLKSR